jgi:hypothetical protein
VKTNGTRERQENVKDKERLREKQHNAKKISQRKKNTKGKYQQNISLPSLKYQ